MTDSVHPDDITPDAPSRSLWAVAWLRLRRNRAAMVALFTLVFLTFIGLFGPLFAPHDYGTVYREYVNTAPSLSAYPAQDEIAEEMESALRRARVDIDTIAIDGSTISVTVSSDRGVDERTTRYIDRSNVFSNASLVTMAEDQSTATFSAEVERLYFIFGTDANGRDLFSRILISIRISIGIGVLATGVALFIGVVYGATAGFIGGRIDNLMMRLVDILYSLPFIFFVILLVVFFGRNVVLMFIAVGAVEWLDMARIVRGQTLALRNREFVQAAESLGVRNAAIVRRHIIPNVLGTVVIYMTLLIPKVILLESFLSFLGLGVQEPLTSLGVLISEGAKNIQSFPHLLIFPAIALSVLLFALNFLGDGLRDALDPKDR